MINITKIYLVTNCYGDPNKVYIGKTISSREAAHRKTYGHNIIYTYIDEIYSVNRKDWEKLETKWIQHYIDLGYDVVNKRKKGGGGLEFHPLKGYPRFAAWRRLPNGKFKVRRMFMAAFAKPLLCAGRFISTKFNLKRNDYYSKNERR